MKQVWNLMICSSLLTALTASMVPPVHGVQEETKLDATVVLVIDTSGSMMGQPIEQAIAAASLFAAGGDSSMAMGVVRFSTRAQVVAPLKPADGEHRKQMIRAISSLRADAGTDLLGGLAEALTIQQAVDSRSKWIIVLTDGHHSEGFPAIVTRHQRDVNDVKRAGEIVAGVARSKGIRLVTIGLGGRTERTLLQSMAVQTNGVYLDVPEPAQLVEAYVKLLQQIGGYIATTSMDGINVGPSYRDLKVFAAIPGGTLPGADGLRVEREGIDVLTEGFDAWADPRLGLHAIQHHAPATGRYRVYFDRPLTDKDRAFILARDRRRWSALFSVISDDPFMPVRVAVHGPNATEAGDWHGIVELANVNDGKVIGRAPIKADANGLSGEVFADEGGRIQRAGIYNARVHLESKSGWSADFHQTVELDPAVIAVNATIVRYIDSKDKGRNDIGGKFTAGSSLDLGQVKPNSTQRLWLRLRSTQAAKGRAVRIESVPGSHLSFASAEKIELTGEQQDVPVDVISSEHISGTDRAMLRLQFISHKPERSIINGVDQPVLLSVIAHARRKRTTHLLLLDRDGNVVENRTCKHRVDSPVVNHRLTLHLTVIGDGNDIDDNGLSWKIDKVNNNELDGVICAFDDAVATQINGAPRFTIRLTVPAQAAPGVRRFVFHLADPAPDVQLAPDSKTFAVELEVPVPEIRVALSEEFEDANVRHRVAFIDWVQWRLSGNPIESRKTVRVHMGSSGLAETVGCRIGDLNFGGSGSVSDQTIDIRGESELDAAIELDWHSDGPASQRLLTSVQCDYKHFRVVGSSGEPLEVDPQTGLYVLGDVEIEGPSWLLPGLLLAVLAGLVQLDRARRRPVPGQLVNRGGEASSVHFGRRRHVITLNGCVFKVRRRWHTVFIRMIRGTSDHDVVMVCCQQGHCRDLRIASGWISIHQGDVLTVNGSEYEYVAPIVAHCSAMTSDESVDLTAAPSLHHFG